LEEVSRKFAILTTIAAGLLVVDTAHAQPISIFSDPDFSDSAGDWDIEGVAIGKGNTIVCSMQKEAENGASFAYIAMISAGSNGFIVIDVYITPTTLPEGSSPKVAIFFDGKKAVELTGGVKKGLLHVDLAKLRPEELIQIIDLFKVSKKLAEVAFLKGHPSEKITVDLADGDEAFDKRGVVRRR
jgi:hypothetical protein